MDKQNCLSSLLAHNSTHGLDALLTPAPSGKTREQELEEAVVMLRQTLADVRTKSNGSGTCCCGDPMESHGFGHNHSAVDEIDHFIDLTLLQTDGLVSEH